MKLSKKQTLKCLWPYLKPHAVMLGMLLVLALVNVWCTLTIPIEFGDAIDMIVSGEAGAVWQVVPRILGYLAVAALCQYFTGFFNNRLSYKIVESIRNDAFSHLNKLPFSYLDASDSGDIISRIITDTDQLADGLLLGFTQLFTGVATIIGTIVVMLRLNAKITIAVILISPLSLFVAKFISQRTYSLFKKQSETRGIQTSIINESLSEIKTIKAYAAEDSFIEKFDKNNKELKEIALKALFFSSLTNPCTRFVNSVVYAVVALLGAFSVLSGNLTVGLWTCFLNYANQYTKPFNEISGVITELTASLAGATRVFEILNVSAEEPDRPESKSLDNVKGDIELSHVTFSYKEDVKLIEDLNLSVTKGKKVAIVGPTGCGKTTLINLLMRFYDPVKGTISVDNEDNRNYTKDSLRKSFGMVLQDTFLLNGTVRDNICMGLKDVKEEDIIEAAKKTRAHSFIKKLENGYDTVIDNKNTLLSQGEKQLICITRLMLRKPPMLILDEATSSIDTKTEMLISDAFTELMKDKTSFIVAHRLSTIVNSDIIIAMNNGKIMEMGNHEKLMANKGFYYNLYNSGLAGAANE